MKAVVYEQYGGPEALRLVEIEKPTPKEGEVLIHVAGATYNPVDAAIRSGVFPIPVAMPAIPGSEASGVVEALGAGVDNVAVGDKVIVELLPAQGGAAEYICAPATHVVAAPKTMDLADAAGVPLVCQTAYQGLFVHAKVEQGQRVLVVGAGGAVGGVAVQMAHQVGAYVVATASGNDVERVKTLGADEVIDYKKTNIADAISAPVDAAVVFAPANLTPYYSVVKTGGRLVSAASPTDDAPSTIEVIRLFGQNNSALLAKIVEMIDAGQLTVPIGFRGRLEDVPYIHTYPPHAGKAIFRI